MRHPLRSAGVLVLALMSAGCGSSPTPPDHVVAFAAASLRDAFTAIGTDSDVPVDFSFAGSADLLTQLTHGAPADVFASADSPTMDKAVAAGLVAGRPVAFATNVLTIAVARGNPKGIKSFRDLTAVSVVVCAPEVPCGASLPAIERHTGTMLSPVSEESSVTDVLNKVTTGQADAGVVYLTDARSAGDNVVAVPFPEATSVAGPNVYRIAVLRQARDPGLAQRFIDRVLGPSGRAVLSAEGFGAP